MRVKKVTFIFQDAFGECVSTIGYKLDNGLVVHKSNARVTNPCWVVSYMNGQRLPNLPVIGSRKKAVEFAERLQP